MCTISLHQVSSYSPHYATFSPAVRTLVEERSYQSKFYVFQLKIFAVVSNFHWHNYRILLVYATVMFILSTTHAALSVSELLQGFVFEGESMPGGPAVFYRINVFPKRKAIYIVNVCHAFPLRVLFFYLLRLRKC